MALFQNSNGENVEIGNLKFKITNESISKVMRSSYISEGFIKREPLIIAHYEKFLKPPYQMLSWSGGVLCRCLDENWYPLVTVLQRFITCVGMYAIIFLYHIRLLLHFSEKWEVKFPLFLHKHLRKMERRVQSIEKTPRLVHIIIVN